MKLPNEKTALLTAKNSHPHNEHLSTSDIEKNEETNDNKVSKSDLIKSFFLFHASLAVFTVSNAVSSIIINKKDWQVTWDLLNKNYIVIFFWWRGRTNIFNLGL